MKLSQLATRIGTLGLAAGLLTLVGCGTLPTPLGTPDGGSLGAFDATTIVDLPGIPVGVNLAVGGKAQGFNVTGTAQVTRLDATEMDVNATITGHVVFVSQTKVVTFSIAAANDPTWPFTVTVVNHTDNTTQTNKAQLVAHTPGHSTFKADDGKTAQVTADGQGHAEIQNGEVDLQIAAPGQLPAPLALPLRNGRDRFPLFH